MERTSHEEDHVDQKKPVPLQCYFSFFDEYLGGIGLFFTNPLAFEVCVGLGKAETECDD